MSATASAAIPPSPLILINEEQPINDKPLSSLHRSNTLKHTKCTIHNVDNPFAPLRADEKCESVDLVKPRSQSYTCLTKLSKKTDVDEHSKATFDDLSKSATASLMMQMKHQLDGDTKDTVHAASTQNKICQTKTPEFADFAEKHIVRYPDYTNSEVKLTFFQELRTNDDVCGTVSGMGDFLQPEMTLSALVEPLRIPLRREKCTKPNIRFVLDDSHNSALSEIMPVISKNKTADKFQYVP